MDLRKLALILAFSTLVIVSVRFSIAPIAYRSFEIILPEEVSVYPGEEVEIKGGILNTGMYSLHWFNLTLLGLPENFEYTIEPNYWEHLMILREWNPKVGVYRVPYNFTIKIKVPKNASGLFLINITGQEFLSWRKVSNSSLMILRILPVANFTLTNISIPEEVKEFEPFNISMVVNNIGETVGNINISFELPSDWNISEKSILLTLQPNESKELTFEIIPSNTSGEIKIVAEYPYRREVMRIEKVGPYLIPKPKEVVEIPEVKLPTGLLALVESIKTLPDYIKGVIIILIIIIVYNIFSIVKARREKKKPEEIKKEKKKGEAEI